MGLLSPLFPKSPLEVAIRAIVHGHATPEKDGRGEGEGEDQIIPDQVYPQYNLETLCL